MSHRGKMFLEKHMRKWGRRWVAQQPAAGQN